MSDSEVTGWFLSSGYRVKVSTGSNRSQSCTVLYKSRLALTASFWVDEGRFVHCSVPQALPRGPGIWKLNVSVLEEDEYVALVASFWASWRTKKSDFLTVVDW